MIGVVGLGVTGPLQFYAQLGVEAACQHAALEFETLDEPDRDPLLKPWYNPFRKGPNGTAAPQANYVATRLVGEHLLERTAPLEFTRQVHQDMSIGTDKIFVPLVHAAAFVEPAGEAGTLSRCGPAPRQRRARSGRRRCVQPLRRPAGLSRHTSHR